MTSKEQFGKTALLRSILVRNKKTFFFLLEKVFCKFFTLAEILAQCDEDGENFIFCLARWGSVEMQKFAFKKLKTELTEEDFKKALKVKIDHNVLHNTCCNNKKSVKFLLNEIEKNLGKEELQKMLKEVDKDGKTPYDCALQNRI